MNNKIKILFLLDFYPFPENKNGATKIIANIINRLGDNYEIDVLHTDKLPDDFDSISKKINFFYEDIKCSKKQSKVNQFKFIHSSVLSKKQIKHIYKKYNIHQYDIVHSALHSFLYLFKYKNNVVYGINDSMSNGCLNGTLKGLTKYFYYRLVELNVSLKNNTIAVVSKNDAKAYYFNKCLILPNGVDTKEYHPVNHKTNINEFVFHGVLDYQVNIDSIKYMSGILKVASKDYKLNLVGRLNRNNPNQIIKTFNSLGNCNYIGEVDNIANEITKYNFYFAAMKTGAGIKNKVLEAMACGMIVIVNEKTIEGFSNKESLKKAIYIIKDSNDLTSLLHKKNEWEEKKKLAIQYVTNNYSWDNYMKVLGTHYASLI